MCPHCHVKLIQSECHVCNHPRDVECTEWCRKCHREPVYEEGLCYACKRYRRP